MLRLNESVPRIVHLELQSTYDQTMGQRLVEYNVLLHGRHGLPVRRMLVLFGVERLGPPDAPTLAALEVIDDPAQLERLGQRLVMVASWGELLTLP